MNSVELGRAMHPTSSKMWRFGTSRVSERAGICQPLDGPSTEVGSAHYFATQAQRGAGGGTYGRERQMAACALAAAGCTVAEITDALARADAYFIEELGLTPDSPLRIPGNRPR